MKNIHILPTDKPSNGYILGKCIKELSDVKIGQFTKTYYLMFDEEYFKPHNIYITSDEEIKEGEYGLSRLGEICKFHSGYDYRYYAKIILTDNEDLIKDGVQAIDDEFLQWFVQNPSCEEVEVEKYHGIKTSIAEISSVSGNDDYDWQGIGDNRDYRIIIPKEEELFERANKMSDEELLTFGKSCFYKGFEKAKKDDANCYTAFREEIGSLILKFKNK